MDRRDLLKQTIGLSIVLASLSLAAGEAAAVEGESEKHFATEFMKLLSAGKIAEAYSLTSEHFRRRTDAAAFDRLVKEGMLDETVSCSWHVASRTEYRLFGYYSLTVKLYGTLTAKNGTQHLTTFVVVKTSDKERLDRLLVGDNMFAPPQIAD